jgi:ABC-type nickel/cobalt efflux system permease component RcnA
LYLFPLSNGTRPFITGVLLLSVIYIVLALALFFDDHVDPWYVTTGRVLIAIVLLWMMWAAASYHPPRAEQERKLATSEDDDKTND